MRSQDRLLERDGVNSAGEGLAKALGSFPSIAGTPTVGETLTGTNASFNGSPTITVTRAWLRDGTPIAAATGATYVLVEADEDAVITFRNTASNAFGTVTSLSTPVGPIAAE
jgi:hypothetical protein